MAGNGNSVSDTPSLRRYPSKLFVEVTTRCNLNCVMCVKQNPGHGLTDGDLPPEFFTALEPALPNLEALILNGIGEPLLSLNLDSYVRRARKLMPKESWIGFQTNGLLLTNLRALSLVEAGVDRICISIDAVSPEMFSRVRAGGEVDSIDNAFKALVRAKERCGSERLQIGVEFVAMRSNLHELPAAIAWAARSGASFAIVTHVLPYDEKHASEIAYSTCSDQALALYERWQGNAMAEGLDLRTYFTARFAKYSRTQPEQRIVDLVDAMKAEAEAKGITLDLKKLFRIDQSQYEELDEIFADTEKIARDAGLDLRLPAVALKEQRTCNFVEDGAAFVSWNGDISPCYFLWHRYQCHASGWTQHVQPKVFGNIKRTGILDIWNSDAFKSFRRDVLEYDYPSCASCGLAPCDYVDGKEFEQDCHIRNVPCGACLWCMGVFQCLH
jgi:putative metalloenzyme radical SAM/SPASM domain maturase